MKKEKNGFRMPTPVTIMGRSSSITNSFVNGVIPCIPPNEEELEKVYKHFGMKKDNVVCVYCGENATEWDHFHPLIKDKKPTGYFSEINNLVPACSKCNQSKRNVEWRVWMESSQSSQAQHLRAKTDYQQRIKKLEEYAKNYPAHKINFNNVRGWEEYMSMREDVIQKMKEAQEVSNRIKEEIKNIFSK